jgi:predicted PurR-regulated permease PerM
MRPLVALACMVIVLAAVKLASAVVVPLLLGLTLAIAFRPVGEALARRGLPPAATALVTIVTVLIALAVATWLLVLAATTFVDALPRYQEALLSLRDDAVAWLNGHEMYSAARAIERWDPTPYFVSTARTGLWGAGHVLQVLFLVVLITIFIQLEATAYRRKLARVFGGAAPLRHARAALDEVQHYLAIKVMLSIGAGVVLGLWCWAWGVPNPLLWGVLAFLLNFIPYVGSLIAAVPPILLGLVDGGAGTAAAVALGYIGANLAENVVEPWLMGKTLDVSPLAVLLAMLLWGYVLGPIGALLSVPLTMATRAILARHEDLSWVATLLSGASANAPGASTPPEAAPAARAIEK